jgi:hypothetical protein
MFRLEQGFPPPPDWTWRFCRQGVLEPGDSDEHIGTVPLVVVTVGVTLPSTSSLKVLMEI